MRYNPHADHTLLIGPYDDSVIQHGSLTSPVLRDYAIDPAARIDLRELRYQWLDHALKGGRAASAIERAASTTKSWAPTNGNMRPLSRRWRRARRSTTWMPRASGGEPPALEAQEPEACGDRARRSVSRIARMRAGCRRPI